MTGAVTESGGDYSPVSGPARDTVEADKKRKAKERQDAAIAERQAQAKERRKREANKPEPVVEPVVEPVEDPLTDEKEIANLAVEEAKRRSKKMRTGTKTVLTSPLGAVTSANTAVTRLGGA